MWRKRTILLLVAKVIKKKDLREELRDYLHLYVVKTQGSGMEIEPIGMMTIEIIA